ncbi:phosphoribosylformylglycinamidine cyclo-ligase [Hymenobacter daecheongensis DSM 21074]|uniref:Phosphoribosylformylglycinamidine cyclo-ligase n=1 Tax=Hymenobacter daecheongensis DSM 21074 TaxID=1121955 RepID=A0A1M6L532_9BACT|nr:AIR synthase-related protein [Hymenobacter daecheongensis]SHJ66315.1 phosphoribosylformylglycinamidine cyclo-ligase [Hymenobacter daecheongensis DSM 21074]
MSQTSADTTLKATAGYSIEEGNAASKNAYQWAQKTFSTRAGKPGEPAQDLAGGFSNEIRFGAERLGIGSDGIGTKIEVAERMDRYDTLGYDLIAMVADDLVVAGFVPTNLSNIIDVNTLNYEVVDELMRGLHDAAQFSQMAVTGGEIAELGNRIGGYPGAKMNFNWCSTAVGVLHPSLERPLSGANVRAGQAVVALRSPSFRSNGYSLARRALTKAFGEAWHTAPYTGTDAAAFHNYAWNNPLASSGAPAPMERGPGGEVTWGDVMLAPSLIYSPGVAAVLDAGLPLHAAAHITGGGIADNFKRVLKNGLGAELNHLFEPLPAMQQLAELAGITPTEAYLYWNMGNGMLLVTDEDQAEAVAASVRGNGYAAQVAGRITAGPGVTLRVGAGELRYT